jgi:hypothetical protein
MNTISLSFDEHVKTWRKWKQRQSMSRYYQKNREKILQNRKEYSRTKWRNTPEIRLKQRNRNVATRIKALSLINPKLLCSRCGCCDIRFLEINHKNGGGGAEQRNHMSWGHVFNLKIINGERDTSDLELLCRPCNHIHYLEQKYGEKIPLKVKWNPQPEIDIRNFAWVRVK